MRYDRCKWVLGALGAALVGPAAAGSRDEVPLADDLRAEARRAEAACLPLLLEFAADYCEYCDLLEEEVLKPMRRNRDYDTRVVMRKLVLDRSAELRDFNGGTTSASELASRYQIDVTPTLIFVDSRGDELAERMIGVTTLDFYGGYLDQALDAAGRKLHQRRDCE